jgi:hypothetical protein
MDPFSTITTVVQLTESVRKALKAAATHDYVPQDRANLMTEISILNSLLVVLQSRVQEAKDENPWFASVRALANDNGPLDRLKSTLERMLSKLAPVQGIQKIGQQINWKFDKAETKNILSEAERVKTLVSLALTNDLL